MPYLAKVKSWVRRRKLSAEGTHSTDEDEAHLPQQQKEASAATARSPIAQSLFRNQALSGQRLFGKQAAPTHELPNHVAGERTEGAYQKEKSAHKAPGEVRFAVDCAARSLESAQGGRLGGNEEGVAQERPGAGPSSGSEQQAVGVRKQLNVGEGNSLGSAPGTPQSQSQRQQNSAEVGTGSDPAVAQGVDTRVADISCHINSPQPGLNKDSKLKGKAREVPQDAEREDCGYVPLSRYDHILAAVALPTLRPRGGADWWETAPAHVEHQPNKEETCADMNRLSQILTAVAIPTAKEADPLESGGQSLAGFENGHRDDGAGPSSRNAGKAWGEERERRIAEDDGHIQRDEEEDNTRAVEVLEHDQDDMDEEDSPHLVTHRHHPRPPLPPPVQQLFDKQDALTAQLLMQDADAAQQPLLTRLENIRALLLESGPALGAQELESLQGEVEAMALYAAFAAEEHDAELDRRMSASLQEEFDQEMAEQLERDCGWCSPAEQDQLVECCICLEEVPTKDCIAPCVAADVSSDGTASEDTGSEGESSASGSAPPALPAGVCSHWHCIDCLRQYATVKVMDDRTPRIPCTRASEGCPAVFPFENVEWLLGDKETQVYLALLAEASIATKVYCPFDGCTAVMDCADDERGPDSICAVCKRVFCRECRVAWHKDQTCEEYQSAKEDEPLHALAKKKNWKPCPKCRNMIERKDGCNFMTCKCGAGFCYKCGAAYTSLKATASNSHGTPGCNCKLFSY